MPDRSSPPRLPVYLSTEARSQKGRRMKRRGRRRRWRGRGDHVALPSPRKSSRAWAAGPGRHSLLFTLHKHSQSCSGLTAFTLQAASLCVWVKRVRVSSRDLRGVCIFCEGRFMEKWSVALQIPKKNKKNISFILPFTSCHYFLTLPAQVYLD